MNKKRWNICPQYKVTAIEIHGAQGQLRVNSFLTDDDTRSFCGQCRSRSDYIERDL